MPIHRLVVIVHHGPAQISKNVRDRYGGAEGGVGREVG